MFTFGSHRSLQMAVLGIICMTNCFCNCIAIFTWFVTLGFKFLQLFFIFYILIKAILVLFSVGFYGDFILIIFTEFLILCFSSYEIFLFFLFFIYILVWYCRIIAGIHKIRFVSGYLSVASFDILGCA